METKYTTYDASDFLADDFFVGTMLHPTEESERYWKRLIGEGLVDYREFHTAASLLGNMHRNKPEVPAPRIEAVWERIQETNRQKKQRKTKFPYSLLVVSLLTAAATVALFLFVGPEPTVEIPAGPGFAVIPIDRSAPPSDKIELVSGEVSMTVDGNEANVEYDESGTMTVNRQSVEVAAAEKAPMMQLRVPYGKRAFLKLSDGTALWVNSGSVVGYPSTFEDSRREIFVQGEIYAEVARDENRPFTVFTDKLRVNVLGTSFNVSAYADEAETRVVLASGSVDVKTDRGQRARIEPNQMLAYAGESVAVREVRVENYTSWREGIYIFTQEPIEQVLLRLGRYYNVRMILPESSSGVTCSGKLVLRETLEDQLRGLTEITPMRYLLSGSECSIRFEHPNDPPLSN